MKALHPSLVPANETAEQLGVTRRTLQNWTAAGDFPKPLRLGRRAYYQQEHIDQYLARLAAKTWGDEQEETP